MKYNIPKLQGGGFATFTPYIPSAPTPTTPSGNQTTQPQAASSILDDDTYKELIKNGGLVNDVNNFVDKLARMESSQSMPYLNSNNRATSIRMIGEINQLKRSKEAWDDAIKTASTKGGLNEVAIGSSGEVFIKQDNGTVQALSLDTFKKQTRKGQLLTVAELMNERQYNPQLAGKNEIFNVANNAVGLETITTHIKGLISALGSEAEETSKFYSKTQLSRQLQSTTGRQPSIGEMESLRRLQEIVDTPGDYSTISSKIISERGHLDKAVQYIWSTLGSSAQKKLKATAILNGDQEVSSFLLNMILPLTSHSTSYSIKPEKESVISDNADSAKGNISASPFELQNNGKLGKEIVNWNDPKTGLNMALTGNRVELWENANSNTRIIMEPLQKLLESHTGALLEKSKIYFGTNKVGAGDNLNIIVDGTAGSARVYFPTNSDGSPNYDLMKQINELKKDAPENASPEELTQFYAKKGYNYIQFDNNFQLKPNNAVKPFLLAYGYADEKANSITNNPELKQLSDEEEVDASSVIKTIHDKLKIKSPTGVFNWSNTYYKGNILIPYQDNASILAASMMGNIYEPKTTVTQAKTHSSIEGARVINANSQIFN